MGPNESDKNSAAHRRLPDRNRRRGAGLRVPDRGENAFTLRRASVPVLPPRARRSGSCMSRTFIWSPGRRADRVDPLAPPRLSRIRSSTPATTSATSRPFPAVLRALEPVLAVPGVFVLGSNDYFAPSLKNPARYLTSAHHRRQDNIPLPTADLVEGFISAGWADLTNARSTMSVGGQTLEFVGVDDAHLNYDRYAAVAGPNDPSASLTVGVTHAPYTRVLDSVTVDGAGLVIAGHTHGGQLYLLLYGTLVTNWIFRTDGAPRASRGGGRAQPRHLRGATGAAWMRLSAAWGHRRTRRYGSPCRPEATLLHSDRQAGGRLRFGPDSARAAWLGYSHASLPAPRCGRQL